LSGTPAHLPGLYLDLASRYPYSSSDPEFTPEFSMESIDLVGFICSL